MTKKNFKIYLLTFALLFSLFSLFPISTKAITAQEKTECEKFKKAFEIKVGNSTVDGNFIDDLPSFCSADAIALRAIQIGLAMSGIVAVAFIVIGGYFYLTSAGNEEQTEKGKKILINAVIGLVIIMLAVVIVRIVAKTVQGDLPAPTTPTGGSSGGSNFTDPGTSGGSGPGTGGTDPGSTDPGLGGGETDLASLVEVIPQPKVYASGVYAVTGKISTANAAEFTSSCGSSPTRNSMSLQLEDQALGAPANFFLVNSNGGSYYQAQVSISKMPDTNATGGQITVRVCNKEVKNYSVVFEKPTVSPRGSAEVNQAAKDLEWDVEWPNQGELLVTISNSSINNSRINTLCSATSVADKNIIITADGKPAPDDVTGKPYFPVSQRVYHIFLEGGYPTSMNVGLFVCSNPIPEKSTIQPG
jgi:hypothetical protein